MTGICAATSSSVSAANRPAHPFLVRLPLGGAGPLGGREVPEVHRSGPGQGVGDAAPLRVVLQQRLGLGEQRRREPVAARVHRHADPLVPGQLPGGQDEGGQPAHRVHLRQVRPPAGRLQSADLPLGLPPGQFQTRRPVRGQGPGQPALERPGVQALGVGADPAVAEQLRDEGGAPLRRVVQPVVRGLPAGRDQIGAAAPDEGLRLPPHALAPAGQQLVPQPVRRQ
ncbi:hypothetical protein LUX05_05060 [Streptomyces somaliensis]|nr:hypothetical protein [Streptomyces somaliensis]